MFYLMCYSFTYLIFFYFSNYIIHLKIFFVWNPKFNLIFSFLKVSYLIYNIFQFH